MSEKKEGTDVGTCENRLFWSQVCEIIQLFRYSLERAAWIDFDTGSKVAHEVLSNLFTDNAVFQDVAIMNSVFSKEKAKSKLSAIDIKMLHRIRLIPDVIQQCQWFVDADRERYPRLLYGLVGECDYLLMIQIGYFLCTLHALMNNHM